MSEVEEFVHRAALNLGIRVQVVGEDAISIIRKEHACILFVFAPWSGPVHVLFRILTEMLVEEAFDIPLYVVDVDVYGQSLAGELGVPTHGAAETFWFSNGECVAIKWGYSETSRTELVEATRAIVALRSGHLRMSGKNEK